MKKVSFRRLSASVHWHWRNEQITIEKEKAAILAKNEQLRSNLLRAISHDLRTPLTSISGNASNLLSNADYFDKETKKAAVSGYL